MIRPLGPAMVTQAPTRFWPDSSKSPMHRLVAGDGLSDGGPPKLPAGVQLATPPSFVPPPPPPPPPSPPRIEPRLLHAAIISTQIANLGILPPSRCRPPVRALPLRSYHAD